MGFELRPLMSISLCYIAGIALGRLWLEAPLWALLLPGLLLAAAGWAIWERRLSPFAAFLLLMAAAAGAAAFFIAFYPPQEGKGLLDYADRPIYIEGTIADEPLFYDDHSAYLLQVEKVQEAGIEHPQTGRLLVKVYGDEQEFYRYGERLRLRGTIVEPQGRRVPGGFDYAFYLRSQGIDGLLYPKPVRIKSLGEGDRGWPAASAITLRGRLVSVIDRNLPSPAAELLTGILFGQRSKLPEEVQENFRSSGVGHLLAVSGLHVGLVSALILGLWRLLGLRGKLPLALAILLIFGYAYLTGMRPSALRAAVMLAFSLGALLLERERDLPTAVALAALVTLLFNPLYLFSIGFQLSYIATLSIIYLQPPLAAAASKLKIPRRLRPLLSVTLAAQIGVLPLCAYYFHHIPIGALFFNLLLLPLMAPLVGLGLGGALVGLFWQPAAAALLFPCRLLLELTLFITALSRHPFFYRPLFPPGPAALVALYGLLFALAAFYFSYRRRRREASLDQDEPPGERAGAFVFASQRFPRRALLFAALGIALLLVWGFILVPSASPGLVVTYLDVGQGAAALVEAPCGTILLIDGGGEPPHRGDPGRTGEMVLLPFLRRQGIRSIDLAVISHPHEDHFGGMLPLVEEIPLGALVISPAPGESPFYDQLLESAAARHIPIKKTGAGGSWKAPSGLSMEVFGPPAELFEGTGSDLNNNSLVMRLTYGAVSFLFCGDMEDDAASELLSREKDLLSTVFLVPHHGGFMEALPRLLRAVQPQYAVISVGTNPFGHPREETVAALEQAGVKTFRTDQHGTVTFRTDGSRLQVESMQKPALSR